MERVQAKSAESRRKKAEGTGTGQMRTYVDGNTVRRLQTGPKETTRNRMSASSATRKNRARALQMNLSYVVFLTVAAVATVMMCINYLKLQSKNTALQKSVTVLATQLSETKLENDSEYNRIMSNVDLQQLKETAINDLGMTYASESQMRTYDSQGSDYVKQYQDIPVK